MGAIWLRDLEVVLRAAGPPGALLTVSGWETRSRSTGGYDSLNGIVIHHDAGNNDAASVNYQCYGDPDRPNAAFQVGRKGEVWIMAAGACNTQGMGGPMLGVPINQGNQRLIGIEIGNNGIGEPYPTVQQNTVLWLVRTLAAHYGPIYGFGMNSVISHFEWAPARKNDPAGPSRWAPGGGRWNMAAFRADVGAQPPGDDFMTPEDKAYLDAKFAAVAPHLSDPSIEGWPTFGTGQAVGDTRVIVQQTQGVVNEVLALLKGVDLDAIRQAVIETIEGMTISSQVSPEQVLAIADATVTRLSARTAPDA